MVPFFFFFPPPPPPPPPPTAAAVCSPPPYSWSTHRKRVSSKLLPGCSISFSSTVSATTRRRFPPFSLYVAKLGWYVDEIDDLADMKLGPAPRQQDGFNYASSHLLQPASAYFWICASMRGPLTLVVSSVQDTSNLTTAVLLFHCCQFPWARRSPQTSLTDCHCRGG